jgi:protein involved in polysaccharide export with SLBB domain
MTPAFRLPACPLMRRALVLGLLLLGACPVLAQEFTPEMLEAASRQTGLSKEELLRRYQQQSGGATAAAEEAATEPGRTSLDGINDAVPGTTGVNRFRDSDARVVLPYETLLAEEALRAELAAAEALAEDTGPRFFGEDFFHLDAGLFTPPSFGPVSKDHRLGVGDEIVINVWGDVDLQLTRVVDRDGTIILPRVGKISCAGRTLADVDESIRERLAAIHSSIAVDGDAAGGEAGTFVEVTLGHLRAIRVFVVGNAVRPGSYELSSVSTVLTALYAAGGPTDLGTFRAIDVVRGGEVVGSFDLYEYLLGGSRARDITLQEGDTVFIRDRGAAVRIAGGVRRPMFYEVHESESLADLIRYAGGFSASAAPEVIRIERILPPALRRAGAPDKVFLDVAYDAASMRAADGKPVAVMDGDLITIDDIGDRLENWVDVRGHVKRPGRYEFREGMTVTDLLAAAEGLWPDALTERAVIDRTNPDKSFLAVPVPLARILAGTDAAPLLQAQDILHVFSRWEIQERPRVHITGEVREPLSEDYREGMTLRDLILKAGGLKEGANLLRAEISRLEYEAVTNPDVTERPARTTEIIAVSLDQDFLTSEDSFPLQPYDRVAIRRLPWWEMQKTVKVRGEVFYPGVFSLERKDERLSSVIGRAGGLTPDAYLIGARIVRTQDNVGNIALDLVRALAEPGSQYDIILQDGDEIVVPDQMFTVKVMGEVGFPTSLVWEDGKKINYYVDRAGGYLEKADKGKTRVVWPNGMSLPNKGGSKVVAGSTIIVPVEPPPEGKTTIETIRDITGIVASLAMVWLVVDNTK